jgi:hypothetical protein
MAKTGLSHLHNPRNFECNFNKKGKGNAALPAEQFDHADLQFLDRRGHRVM